MANENIGHIDCQYHDAPLPAVVRRDRKEKLYIYCEECGIISPRAAKFQTYIIKNMRSDLKLELEPTAEIKQNENEDKDGWLL